MFTRFLSAAVVVCAVLASVLVAQVVVIDVVPVGNAGNTNDSTNYGAVAYAYNIGTYEVTNAQYTAFLNAVAATDTYGLYNTNMNASTRAGITRSGSPGSYTYAVKTNAGDGGVPGSVWADKPVVYVSWYDTFRFANRLQNGQPTGAQNAGTTEDGAYTFTGATTVGSRNTGATWALPTENEWYKAAYHKNHGVTGGSANYWDYATATDTVPTAVKATTTGVGQLVLPPNGTKFVL